MAEYLHGVYREWPKAGDALTADSQAAMVVFGTAPVHTLAGGANNVNVPVLVRTIAEARKYFGYSEDWASYTLCEAMHLCLEQKKVGPLVLINVLDPAVHKKDEDTSASLTPSGGEPVDAKSILSLLMLGAPCGTVLTLEACGSDEVEAVQVLSNLFAGKFDEE